MNTERTFRNMKPSLTLLVSGVFIAFILHSIWNMIQIFQPPTCQAGELCYNSYLNAKPSLDLLVFTSDNSRGRNSKLIFNLNTFKYDESLEREIQIDITQMIHNNGTLYIHTIVLPSRKGSKDLTLTEASRISDSTYLRGKLTQVAVPKSSTFNLIKDETKTQMIKPVVHIRSKYSVLICTDELSIPHSNVPPEVINLLRINNKRQFLPMLVEDFFQLRLRDLEEVTENMKKFTFLFVYNPSTIGKFKFLMQMQMTFQHFLSLGFTEKDVDEVKGVFADTNVYLLCATVFIGSIHLLLDFLSFKNDVSFWRSHKSMAGLSTRTVLWRAFSQTVIFLYLCDEGTSSLVLIPSGIGTLIEFWKVNKILKPKLTWRNGVSIRFQKDSEESDEEAQTRRYDEESMKYLSYVLYPLCIGGAIYSLLYQPHKSWYSWTINSLANGVYVFGFLFMLPQLFINYRLKSVAALPWRAFTYRAFNTFIDDIFAFIITMPTAHRLACFRDDVVFLIYLYQRWLYPVDKSRSDDIISEEIPSAEDKKTK